MDRYNLTEVAICRDGRFQTIRGTLFQVGQCLGTLIGQIGIQGGNSSGWCAF